MTDVQKVYGLHIGCRYEGCSLVSLHRTLEGALAAAKREIEDSYRKYTEVPFKPSEPHVPYRWADDSDLIFIAEQEIVE